eukprot:4278643-Amphidinium_carterae.1
MKLVLSYLLVWLKRNSTILRVLDLASALRTIFVWHDSRLEGRRAYCQSEVRHYTGGGKVECLQSPLRSGEVDKSTVSLTLAKSSAHLHTCKLSSQDMTKYSI